MSLETIVNDLVLATDALHDAITDKRTVLDNAAQQAAASLTTTQGLQAQAATSAAIAAAKATEATNNATQIAAYKTAAAALDTTTTATAAVAAQAADAMARFDPARHPFRNKLPSLVLDFGRQSAHKYSPLTGLVRQAITDVVTFTRNSTATYTGPDGLLKTAAINEPRYDYDPVTGECKGILIEEQRTNLLAGGYAPYLVGSGWAHNNAATTNKPSSFSGVDGTLNATDIVDMGTGDNFSFRSTTITSGTTTYVASVYFRKTTGNAVCPSLFLVLLGGTTAANNFIVNTNTGTSAGSTSGSVEDCGAYWKVTCWVTDNNTGNNTAYFRIYPAYNLATDGASTARNDAATGTVTVCCPQLEIGAFKTSHIKSIPTFTSRASTATYLDSNGVLQTAAINTARSAAYDYDGDGVLRPIGLLLEPAATNLITYSQAIDHASWQKIAGGVATAPVVTANYGAAPDGTTTASRVVFALNGGTTIDDNTYLGNNSCTPTVVDTTYTYSVWLKTVDGSTKTLQLSNQGATVSLVTVTGSWQRFQLTAKAADTTRGFRLCLRGAAGTSDSADVLVWGAQMGVGYYATSYIPTAGSQVTRAADVSTSAQSTRAADDAYVGGSSFNAWYRQDAGTVVATVVTPVVPPAGFARVCAINAGTTQDVVTLALNGTNQLWAVTALHGGVADSGFNPAGTVTVGNKQKLGLRVKKDDLTISVGGATPVSDTSVVIPQMTRIDIGGAVTGGELNGHVTRITYYPQAFSNEELQAITTL